MGFNRKYAAPVAIATAMAVVTLAAPLAFAQQADATGEVRRVDAAAGKVTIKHDAIKALDLPTPGRRPEEPSRPEKALPLDEQGVEKLIAAFGGRENIRTVDNCFTRLRVTVNDPAFVKEQALKALPCSGVVQSGCDVQIVYGIRAPEVRQAVERRLNRVVC